MNIQNVTYMSSVL